MPLTKLLTRGPPFIQTAALISLVLRFGRFLACCNQTSRGFSTTSSNPMVENRKLLLRSWEIQPVNAADHSSLELLPQLRPDFNSNKLLVRRIANTERLLHKLHQSKSLIEGYPRPSNDKPTIEQRCILSGSSTRNTGLTRSSQN